MLAFHLPTTVDKEPPLTAFAGASFLIWVDLVCRSINPPAETPISAVISIIGLPCFLWLIRKEKHL